MEYNTLTFLIEIKAEMCKSVNTEKITDEEFNLLLGQTKGHVKKKKDQIRHNPFYLIPLNILEQYSESFIRKFGDGAQTFLNLIDKYLHINKVPKAIFGIHRYHPNLEGDYFKSVDTKEKAYWLGWLYAEGWLSKQGKYIRFGVEIHKEDREDLLLKFANLIGFNLEYLEDEIRRDGVLTDYIRIRFTSDKFAQSLINIGFIVGKEKSKNIELPYFTSRELYLSFLLGYYDGDGKTGTTIITSGSLKFIRQIKNRFNIPFKIWRTDSEWEGVGYNIYLGMNLMRKMLANYKNSLLRKRIRLEKK